jgi:hypothetical protein
VEEDGEQQEEGVCWTHTRMLHVFFSLGRSPPPHPCPPPPPPRPPSQQGTGRCPPRPSPPRTSRGSTASPFAHSRLRPCPRRGRGRRACGHSRRRSGAASCRHRPPHWRRLSWPFPTRTPRAPPLFPCPPPPSPCPRACRGRPRAPLRWPHGGPWCPPHRPVRGGRRRARGGGPQSPPGRLGRQGGGGGGPPRPPARCWRPPREGPGRRARWRSRRPCRAGCRGPRPRRRPRPLRRRRGCG